MCIRDSYISFEGGFHFKGFTLFSITDVSPLTAFLITLCFTLSFGWFQGWLIVKSGIASFIVTLGGLFLLRGVTETSYRAFNKAENQTAGSTTVTDMPCLLYTSDAAAEEDSVALGGRRIIKN